MDRHSSASSAPPASESWSLTDSLWGAVWAEPELESARRKSESAAGGRKPAKKEPERRHSTSEVPAHGARAEGLSPQSKELADTWAALGGGASAPARRVIPEAKARARHPASRPRAESFEGPSRPDDAARQKWRARQWTDNFKEGNVVRWIPATDSDDHEQMVSAISDYLERFGSRQFHQSRRRPCPPSIPCVRTGAA